eukprot:10799476-Ditylum_brightwellii.AAC.1
MRSDTTSEAGSDSSHTQTSSSSTGSRSMISRGRSILASAGRVRARRATPTPSLRNMYRQASSSSKDAGGAT